MEHLLQEKVRSVDFADNIIRSELKNVYFIWGRGKTTVADILRNVYGCFVFGTDEARDRNMAYACPEISLICAAIL